MAAFIEYTKITRSSEGTLDCIGQLTQRVYKEVEYIEDNNIDSPPEVDQIGLLMEIHNDEFVWVGRLKQYTGGVDPKEFRIMPGNNYGILIKEDELEIYKANVIETGNEENKSYTYIPTVKLKFESNGDVNIETTAKVNINAIGEVNISGSTVNLN